LLFPPIGAAAFSWVALVPLVLALRASSSFRTALLLAGLFSWLATASTIPWVSLTLHEHFERDWAFSIAFWLLFSSTALAPYYAVLLGAQEWAARRLPEIGRPFLFAAAWTAAEWLRTQLGFRASWARLGDAHVESVQLRQIADLVGVYGISFLVALANAAIAEVCVFAAGRMRASSASIQQLSIRGGWAASLIPLGVFAALLSTALLYGSWRVESLPKGGTGFEVAVVQGNLEPRLRWSRVSAGSVLKRYAGMTRDVLLPRRKLDSPDALRRPDLVIWPENAIQTGVDDPIYGPPLVELSAITPLLTGAPRSEMQGGIRRSFNSAFFVSAGELAGHYDKRRLLPFSETHPFARLAELVRFGERGELDVNEYTAGTRTAVFEVGEQRFAPLICMEALYPELAREAVRSGATVLANLSNDGWFAGRAGALQHLAMARFRAIETRRPLVRSTTTGISAVIAPDGSILASLGQNERGVLRSELPASPVGLTLYSRIGDAFAIGCAGFVAAGVLVAVALGSGRNKPTCS
jgi:apolipoprotein N-acyltransferase